MIIHPVDPNLNIVRNGLVFWLDPKMQTSYPGSGIDWNDLSGNGNNGILTNGPTYDSTNGGSIVLDGTDDYVDFGDKDSFTLSSGFTLETWFKASGYNGSYTGSLLSKNPNTSINTREYVFGFYNGNLYCWAHSQAISNNYRGRYVSNTSSHVSNNTWVHIVGTYNGGTTNDSFKIYINSTSRDDVNFSSGTFTQMSNTVTPLTFGFPNVGLGGSAYLNGSVAVVRVYNRGLSASEVLHNYNQQKARFGL